MRETDENCCKRRMRKKEVSLYANCRDANEPGVERKMEKTGATNLLPEADPGPCIEWNEYERIGRKVFVQPLIKEAVWIEFFHYV